MNPLKAFKTILFQEAAVALVHEAIRRPPTLESLSMLSNLSSFVQPYNKQTTLYMLLWNSRFDEFFQPFKDIGVFMKTKKKNKWLGWAEVPLTKADKQAISSFLEEDSDLWGMVSADIQEGYRFSFTYDPTKRCIAVRMTGEYTKINKGLSMSARASSPRKALRVLLYKHSVLRKSGLWSDESIDPDDFMS